MWKAPETVTKSKTWTQKTKGISSGTTILVLQNLKQDQNYSQHNYKIKIYQNSDATQINAHNNDVGYDKYNIRNMSRWMQ